MLNFNNDVKHMFLAISIVLIILCIHSFSMQIVYEDADYEDVTHSELRRIMWSNPTPSAKREACLKHAKLLGESGLYHFSATWLNISPLLRKHRYSCV